MPHQDHRRPGNRLPGTYRSKARGAGPRRRRALQPRQHACRRNGWPARSGGPSGIGMGPECLASSCAEPAHYPACPLPALPLRNGALNRMAYGLFLFIRDVCGGDLVDWMDQQLEAVSDPSSPDYPERLGQALIGPIRHVFGVSHKVLNMTLADLLIGADPERSLWVLAGQHMIAIDTLIHNLLHRTGTLAQCGAQHAYGPACYAPRGCAFIVRRLAGEIDARSFDPSFPAIFPRFVQHALWRDGARDGLNVCNGNQIEDSRACANASCPMFESCARVPLRPERLPRAA